MFSAFTDNGNTFIIRAEDIRALEDVENGCMLTYERQGVCHDRIIDGTAQENYQRMIRENLDLQAFVANAQRRQQAGLPTIPVVRGKPNAS